MIKEVQKKEVDRVMYLRKQKADPEKGGRTFMQHNGKWYETTGHTLMEVYDFKKATTQTQTSLF